MKKGAIVSGILIASLSFSTVFAAPDLNTQKSQLNNIKTEKGKITSEISQKKQEVNNINKNIYSLDQKINQSQVKLDELQAQMAGLNVNIKATKNKISEIEKDLEKNEELLQERLRVMYKTSDISYLEILLSSEDITDLLSNVNNIQRVVNHDKTLLDELEQSKQKHMQQKKSLEASKEKMSKIQKEMESEKLLMEGNLGIQFTEKHKIAQDIDKLRIQEEELQKESAAIERQIQSLLAKPTSKSSTQKNYSGGTMHWPLAVKGTITSGYGSRVDPLSGARSFHLGLDIAAPKGTAVYAASDGTVIFSGYKNSYGNVVMIDHGGGIVTVYAHNSSLVSRSGQSVKRGAVISKVGSTGDSTGNHLHFEVRKNGATVNPRNYI